MYYLFATILLTACVGDDPDPSSVVAVDYVGADSGFGYACHSEPGTIITPCTGDAGALGWCDQGICLPQCTQPAYLYGCPPHFTAVGVVSNQCVCEPIRHAQDALFLAPQMDD